MKKITLALDEEIIQKGRKYAAKHNLTLNSLVRRLLQKTVDTGVLVYQLDKRDPPAKRDAYRSLVRELVTRGDAVSKG